MPYTSFMALFDAGAPVKVVAGGGIEGCVIVRNRTGQPAEAEGKTPAPSSSIRWRSCLTTTSRSTASVQGHQGPLYGTTPEAVKAFKAGALDWICNHRAYRHRAAKRRQGFAQAHGRHDIYGKGYTTACWPAAPT